MHLCDPGAYICRRSSHTNKVRDLKYNPRTRELATLSADTSVKIWDTNHLQPVSSVFLSRESETVCMGMSAIQYFFTLTHVGHSIFCYVDPCQPFYIFLRCRRRLDFPTAQAVVVDACVPTETKKF
jgi:WD40 repeat protein